MPVESTGVPGSPVLAITMGDVNGVGPEILAKALARPEILACCHPIIIGDASALDEARAFAPQCPTPKSARSIDELLTTTDPCLVFDAGFPAPPRQPGILNPKAGQCAVEWVKVATQLAIDGRVDGIVTCPINKEGIHRAGYAYSGHTELIAEMTGSADYRMCLFAGPMRVVHITSHLSLQDAIRDVQPERIATSIRTANEALIRMGIGRPRIAVAALNPHAGEAGAFGREDTERVLPAVTQCRREGIDCSGPHPADTVFRRMKDGEFDVVVAMYHDQGHIPLKLIAMDEGVNVTLGLPIVRTSVDHGTAYDIAGKGIAREESLCAAITLASQLAQRRT